MSHSALSARSMCIGLFVALTVVSGTGCSRSSGQPGSGAEATATAADASAFAERLRAAGKAMAAFEAELHSMEEDAAIDLLHPLLDNEDPDVAEHAADLLLALESPHADRIVVLDALGRTGDGMGRLDSPGGRD